MNKKCLTLIYILFDVLAAVVTWVFLYFYRKHIGEGLPPAIIRQAMAVDPKFFAGLAICPVYWVLLHSFTGCYNKIYRKSRLEELETTFGITLVGTLIFFFSFILDDIVTGPRDYIKYFLFLFFLQFFLTYIPRLIITSIINRRIHNGKIGFNTLIVGSDQTALKTYHTVMEQIPRSGIFLMGYIKINYDERDDFQGELSCLGTVDHLSNIIEKHHIDELIIALHNGQRKYIEEIIALARNNKKLTLNLIPQTQDLLMGAVRTSSILYEPFISISPKYLPDWQRYIKRFCDIICSLIALIVLLPLYIFLSLGVKRSSSGPIFYRQERIGYHGKPFSIIKFRSMYQNAEQDVPKLSCKTDPRITPFGKWMRQHRLDETPQFFNVLIGDMSLVGPRPERRYYINKISERAPYYKLLLGVKPGITSWGQVKFGYAENVDQMLERLRWDLLYIENMSIQMDLKILIYTVLIVLKRNGK